MGETKVILGETEETMEIQISKEDSLCGTESICIDLQQALFIKEEIARILHELEIRKEIMNIFPESLKLHLYKLMDVKEMTFDRVGDTYGIDKSDHDLFRIRVLLNDGERKEYCRQIAFGTDLDTFDMQMKMIPDNVSVYFTNAGILGKWLSINSTTDSRRTYKRNDLATLRLLSNNDYADTPVENLVAATAEEDISWNVSDHPIDISSTENDDYSLEDGVEEEPKKVGVSEYIKTLIGRSKSNNTKTKSDNTILDSPTSELLNMLKGDSEQESEQVERSIDEG